MSNEERLLLRLLEVAAAKKLTRSRVFDDDGDLVELRGSWHIALHRGLIPRSMHDDPRLPTLAGWSELAQLQERGSAPRATTGQSVTEPAVRGQLPPAREKAYRQYLDAVEKNPTLLSEATDREVYDWLQEHAEGEQLPTYATWSKYVREGRNHYGTSKHTPRTGRPTGKSVVRRDDIE
jgi:hypothetical protein